MKSITCKPELGLQSINKLSLALNLNTVNTAENDYITPMKATQTPRVQMNPLTTDTKNVLSPVEDNKQRSGAQSARGVKSSSKKPNENRPGTVGRSDIYERSQKFSHI